jgi:photosystem II stability/assembly factor-like uncharacterized protein
MNDDVAARDADRDRRSASLIFVGVLAPVLLALAAGSFGHRAQSPVPTQLRGEIASKDSTADPGPSPDGSETRSVPPGFRPSGASFINEAEGWAIGEAPCGDSMCAVVVRTRDGGDRWEPIGAPATAGESQTGKSADFVSDLRFADQNNGWAFQRQLWTTHDGGASWRRVELGSSIVALETTAGRAFAVMGDCGVELASCSKPFRLYEAAVGTDDWVPVPEVELPHWTLGQLVGRREAVYLVAPPRREAEPPVFFARTEAGQWERRQLPCGEGVHHTLALSDVDDLVYACQTGEGAGGQAPNELQVSSDGGRSWTRIGENTFRGYATAMTAIQKAIFLAVAPADDLLLTTNAGRSYSVVLEAPYIRSVRFSGDRQGVVMAGTTSEGQLFITGDGGSSWEQVRFAT